MSVKTRTPTQAGHLPTTMLKTSENASNIMSRQFEVVQEQPEYHQD